MNKSLRFFLILAAAVPNIAAEDKLVSTKYKYTVSSERWTYGNYDEWEKLGVFLNGSQIGSPPKAFEELAALPILNGDRIKIELKPASEKQGAQAHAYQSSHFIQLWLEKGGIIDLFEGGKQLKAHTVTWTKFFKGGNFVRDQDDALWWSDGQLVGNGAAMAQKFKTWGKERNVVVQYVIPLGFLPPGPMEEGVASATLDELAIQRRLRVITIRPDRRVSQKYFDEVIVPESSRGK